MDSAFVRTNWAIRYTQEYYTLERIREYMTHFARYGPHGELPSTLKIYKDIIDNAHEGMEYEIRHNIAFLNQEGKVLYFEALKEWMTDVRLKQVNIGWVVHEVDEYNTKTLAEFLSRIEIEVHKFQQTENYKHKAHLETYEVTRQAFPGGSLISGLFTQNNFPMKYIETNYKIYCIEERPNLIDTDYLRDYINVLAPIVERFRDIANKYIKLYDEGKLTPTQVIQVTVVPTLPESQSQKGLPASQQRVKVKTPLTAHQIAYFFNLLQEDGLIEADTYKEIHQIISDNFQLKGRRGKEGDLSVARLGKIWSNPDPNAIKFWWNKLVALANKIKKDHPNLPK